MARLREDLASGPTRFNVVDRAAPAQAIELPPPGTESLIVMNFYRGDDLIGQKWWGCPGQPAGRWGTETPHPTFHLVPC